MKILPENTPDTVEQANEVRKPLKSKRLKVINYIGSMYATFDGKNIWELDKGISHILTLCDGSRTHDQIANEIANEIEMTVEDVKVTLSNIIKELETKGFIEYL